MISYKYTYDNEYGVHVRQVPRETGPLTYNQRGQNFKFSIDSAGQLKGVFEKFRFDRDRNHYLDLDIRLTVIPDKTGKWLRIDSILAYILGHVDETHHGEVVQISALIIPHIWKLHDVLELYLIALGNQHYSTFKLSDFAEYCKTNNLQSSDRQDLLGTKAINWESYQITDQAVIDKAKEIAEITPWTGTIYYQNLDRAFTGVDFANYVLQFLRESGIQEWIPTENDLTVSFTCDKYDENFSNKFYLDNIKGGVSYKQTEETAEEFTEDSGLQINAITRNYNSNEKFVISSFNVPKYWSQDTDITIAPLVLVPQNVEQFQGPTDTWYSVSGEYENVLNSFTKIGEEQTGRHAFDYFSLKNVQAPYIDQIICTYGSGQKSLDFEYYTGNGEYYITVTNWSPGDKISLGETKYINADVYLPLDYTKINTSKDLEETVKGLIAKSPTDTSRSFLIGDAEIVSGYFTEEGFRGSVKFPITCRNRSFGENTKIELSLEPRFSEGLSDKHIPFAEIYFYSAPEFIIPKDTVLNIYNDSCDRLFAFNTVGFGSADVAEFEIWLESDDLTEFEKRKIEFDFTQSGTRFDLRFKDSEIRRRNRVFYNFTDREFTGTIKFKWTVNGEAFDVIYEIPVIYHNTPLTLWDPKDNLTIPADETSTSYKFEDIMNVVYGAGDIFVDGFGATGTGAVILSDQNIFESADFIISDNKANLVIKGLKENYYVNPRQTRVNIYLQYTDDEGNLQYIDDKEMWPQTQLTIIQEGLGFVDPVIDDDTLYGVKEEQTILRLNNMVSTPITQNNYSVNMQTLEQPQLSISDDLYFLDASPVYVDGNQKQVILKYYTSLTGIPSVKYTNTDGFLPGINSVSVDEVQKQVIVNMNYNKGQTTQGYVTLTIGNKSVSMGVFQNRSDEYFDLENTSFSVPYMNYGFGIKYETNTLTPNDIKVRHASGDNIMTSYSVDSQVVVIQVGLNPLLSSRTEFLDVYVQDEAGQDVFVQTITLMQNGNPKGMNFTVESDDGDYVLFTGVPETLTGGIYSYGGLPSGYQILAENNIYKDGFSIYTTRAGGDDNNPVFRIIPSVSSATATGPVEIPVHFDLVFGSTVLGTKPVIFTVTKDDVLLTPKELIFNYRGVANEGINYITVKSKEAGAHNIRILTDISKLPFTVRVSEDSIYVTGLETRISSSPQTWTINCTADGIGDFSFKITQLASPHTYEYPIWKDIYVDLPEEHNYFRLVNISSGFIMYEGMIYGFITSQVGVTDVLRDYMTTVSDPFVNTFTSSQYLLVDMQTSSDGSNWQSTYTFRLYYNYSYDEEHKVYLEAQPIDYFDPRQYLLFTFQSYDNVQENVEITKTFGTSAPQTQAISAYNEQKTYVSRATSNYSIKIKTSLEERIFKDRCTNTNYAVYYINRYGGWSWMLFQGKNLKTDKTQQSTYKMDFDNNVGTEFNTKVYQNDVTETWQLTSDYLSDKQSELLKHLYSSPLVYLHDLKVNKVMSVLVDTKSFDYKTYRNQGRKMFTHTIKVNGSQTKIIL